MTLETFQALKRSGRLKAIVAERARFRAEAVAGGWSDRGADTYRALLAAAALIDFLLAEGARPAALKKDLPKWLVATIEQMSAVYLTALPAKRR